MEEVRLLLRFLDAVRTRTRRAEVLASFNLFLALTMLLLLGGVVGDHAVGFPVPVRVVYFALLTLTAASFLAVAVVRPLFRRLSRPYCARLIEKRLPELQGSLLAFAEFPDKESPVAAALAARALKRLEGRSPADFAPAGKVVNSFALFAVVFLAFAVYTTFSPKSVLLSLERLLYPTSALAVPTATRITAVKPGDAVVLEGAKVFFRVSVEGEEPSEVLVRRRFEEGGDVVRLTAVAPGEYEAALPAAVASFDYFVEAGDASAGPFRVKVHPVPAVTAVTFAVRPLSYTGVEPFEESGRLVRFPAGSSVEVRITTSTAVRRAWVIARGNTKPMKKIGGDSALAVLSPRSPVSLFFRYEDTAGFESAASAVFRLVPLPDRPPLVAIVLPLDGASVPLKMPLTVKGSARDDYGLSALRLEYSVNGGPWVKEALSVPPAARAVEMRSVLVPERKGWKPGDRVAFRFAASDNREPDPQSSRSAERTVVIEPPGAEDINNPASPPPDESRAEAVEKKDEEKPREDEEKADDPDEVEKKLDDMAEKDREALERIKKKLEEEEKKEKEGERKPPGDRPPRSLPPPSPSPSPSPAPASSASPAPRSPAPSPVSSGSPPPGSPSRSSLPGTASGPARTSSPAPSPAPRASSLPASPARLSPAPGRSAAPSASAAPGASLRPSGAPSPHPTSRPSGAPSASARPSAVPSAAPSGRPEVRPSGPPPSPGVTLPPRPGASSPPRSPGRTSLPLSPGGSKTAPGRSGKPRASAVPGGKGSPKPGVSAAPSSPAEGRSPSPGARRSASPSGASASPKPGAPNRSAPPPSGTSRPGKPGERAGEKPSGGERRPKSPADEIERILDRIDEALREGKLTEADLERAGLSRERLEKYRRLLRLRKILRREVAGPRNAPGRKIESGSVGGSVGARGAGKEEGKREAKEAKRAEERVTGSYRALIEAFRKSRRGR